MARGDPGMTSLLLADTALSVGLAGLVEIAWASAFPHKRSYIPLLYFVFIYFFVFYFL